jgi:hypothetical protein
MQGRASAADLAAGKWAKGFHCNAREIAHVGGSGGYRVERYVDPAGHECAYWDSTLLYPTSLPTQGVEGPGTYVLDMHDPAHPVITDTLVTPAMQSPHESVRLNAKRGLLVADMGNPVAHPGFVDVYDVKQDCRKPKLLASAPLGVLGHEGGFSPDGNTFWVASLYAHTLAAIDLTNPFQGYQGHYCSLPSRVDPAIVACAFINSGLRVFDISDVRRPREIAYFNKPVVPGSAKEQPLRSGAFAMSAPAYDEATGDIWYTDGNSGFYVVRLTGAARRARFAPVITNPGN